MSFQVTYSSARNLAIRFVDHARLGFSKNIQAHDKNLLEKLGDRGLWPVENLPRILWDMAIDPKVITVAATAFAMLADSYGFYPEETTAFAKAAWALLPTIPFWAGKFTIYMVSIETILSLGIRAEGRFTNKALMDKFYEKQLVAEHS